MGISMSMIAVDQERLEAVIANSAAQKSFGKRRLFGLLPPKVEAYQPTAIDDLIEEKLEAMSDDVDDLDKAWDVIMHAVNDLHISGDAPEAATHAVAGKRSETGGPMGGFGWSPKDDVLAISKALQSVDQKAFSAAVLRVPDTAIWRASFPMKDLNISTRTLSDLDSSMTGQPLIIRPS